MERARCWSQQVDIGADRPRTNTTAMSNTWHPLFASSIKAVVCPSPWQHIAAVQEPLRLLVQEAMEKPLLLEGNWSFAEPLLLRARAQETLGQSAPVIVWVLCEIEDESVFDGAREIGCFMLREDGSVKTYDRSVAAELGGWEWERTTFVPLGSSTDREIPRTLEDVKNLETESTWQTEEMQRQHDQEMDAMYGG